jgi:hypothetical protein
LYAPKQRILKNQKTACFLPLFENSEKLKKTSFERNSLFFSRERHQRSTVKDVFNLQCFLELLMSPFLAFFRTFRPLHSQRKTKLFFDGFKVFGNLLFFELEILKKKATGEKKAIFMGNFLRKLNI